MNNNDVSVEIGTVSVYKVKNITHRTWADFCVEMGKGFVKLSINSDYGAFAYNWFAADDDPVAFLKRLNMSYVIAKFVGQDIKEVDLETTVRMIKRRIIERRRDDNISWGMAREFWDNIPDIFSGTQDEYCMRSRMVEMEGFDDIFGDSGCIPIQYKMKQIYINFWEELWAPFVAALEKSVENP